MDASGPARFASIFFGVHADAGWGGSSPIAGEGPTQGQVTMRA